MSNGDSVGIEKVFKGFCQDIEKLARDSDWSVRSQRLRSKDVSRESWILGRGEDDFFYGSGIHRMNQSVMLNRII
jgi:hypothetical protein